MSIDNNEPNTTDVSPAKESAPTPLISAAQISRSNHPLKSIPDGRFHALGEHANRIANNARGTTENHHIALLGEDVTVRFLGIEERLDTKVYPDGGDGGTDFPYRGATIDVKTVGRYRNDPSLTVDAYKPLTADYYVLASRVSKTACRLIGYAPRRVVRKAPRQFHQGEPYYIVGQEDLFPFVRGALG